MATNEKDLSPIRCANPDCRVATDGKCVEGFPELATCPQYGKDPIDKLSVESSVEVSKDGLSLPLSTTLDVREANELFADRLTNLIAIIGPHEAGKTSLIAGLYDLFQGGPVGDIAFATSNTLHSFEQICHDSRAASRRKTPHIERTNRGEVRFYHLELVDQLAGARAVMLLADRAGEEYSDTREDPDSAVGLPELSRADTITMLVDGAKLLDSGHRHNVRSEVRLTLQAFLDAGVIRPWQRLAVVLTKIDAIHSSGNGRAQALEYFASIVQAVTENFGGYFANISSFQVAASPASGGAKRGEGLLELLKFWLAPGLRYEPKEVRRIDILPSRAFGRLQFASAGTN
ncbi:hypothetical protein [Rhodanobacter sp. MP1X3]|uniref:TRAFAC clade GTPase domain-containing protein n=1 Tax=Rhodanobacter sp. MP1X3 TaxID=2723086 RepID=UPI00161FF954|nr:hypothetical protein [Rhodanobacter sp. MP1X3]MBB6241978.1 hypothetical protein [Rhodanobacter sp. MP1X3]